MFVRRRDEPRGLPWLGAAMALMRSRLATWIWKLPVNQAFTCDAGRGIWGFPKTIEQITFAESEGAVVVPARHGRTPRAHDSDGAAAGPGRSRTRR